MQDDTNISGSLGPSLPVAALFFERDGTMNLIMMEDVDDHDEASVKLVSDYLNYALERDDWMSEFADVLHVLQQAATRKKNVPHLRLVKSDRRDIN